MDQPNSTDMPGILLSLLQDIGRKVDDLAKDHVTRTDLSELRRYIDDRIDRISDRYVTKDELEPIQKDVEQLRTLSLSEMQRLVAFIGGVIGIISGVIVLLHYLH